jgi:hydroxylaminobenzene mutase
MQLTSGAKDACAFAHAALFKRRLQLIPCWADLVSVAIGETMISSLTVRQGHRLLQIGMFLFLAALLVGLAVPRFAVPRLGLSAHLLGLMQGLFLIVTGLVWGRLQLPVPIFRVGFWLALFGCFAPLAANLLGAIWGAGNTLLPMAAGPAHGNALQERIITILLRAGGVAMIAAIILILWGLRIPGSRAAQRDEADKARAG